jgi:hypothetical protein
MPARQRMAMLLMGYFPMLHASGALLLGIDACLSRSAGLALASGACLFGLPPLLARLGGLLKPLPHGRVDVGDPAFLGWWWAFQCQMIFNRLPVLEECLRLIPGAYSFWLRLWGSRIGRLVYWAPGMRILDRGLLEIGNGVLFGAGVRLNPHVITRESDGRMLLSVAPVRIGQGVLMGGYSLATAGCSIAEHESPSAHSLLPPFCEWRDGRRVRADRTRTPS